jgi:hypothetical protein
MRIKRFHPTAWIPKLQDFLEELFEEEEEEELDPYQENRGEQTKQPALADEAKPARKYPRAWTLFRFLDIVLSILTLLPVLGYTSSHWTIHYVVDTRELHEHILMTALFLGLGMILLYTTFHKIMRVLLIGSVLVLGVLALVSDKQNISRFWTSYSKQVRSLPVRLEDQVKGHLYHAAEVELKLTGLVTKEAGQQNLKGFLEDAGIDEPCTWSSCISLHQKIYESWTYKADPFYKELYRPPHKTIRNFTGDCDDYALLVSTLFKTLGYQTRIIVTDHHVYPELAIPHDSIYFLRVEPRIKAMPSYQIKGSPPLFFRRDRNGTIWLNLDYTAPFPGGPYLSEQVYKVIDLDSYED